MTSRRNGGIVVLKEFGELANYELSELIRQTRLPVGRFAQSANSLNYSNS